MCPVDDHPVHPKTSRTGLVLHGCHTDNGHNRRSTHAVKDGLVSVGIGVVAYKVRMINDPMTRECQYTVSRDGLTDKACDGCTNRRSV